MLTVYFYEVNSPEELVKMKRLCEKYFARWKIIKSSSKERVMIIESTLLSRFLIWLHHDDPMPVVVVRNR